MAILIMPAHERGDSRGKVLAWHKRVGDWVEKGDKLFTYSMESGVYLAVCEQAGRLSAIYLPEAERFLPRLRDTLQALDRHIR